MQTDMTVRQRVDLQTDRQTEGGWTDSEWTRRKKVGEVGLNNDVCEIVNR